MQIIAISPQMKINMQPRMVHEAKIARQMRFDFDQA